MHIKNASKKNILKKYILKKKQLGAPLLSERTNCHVSSQPRARGAAKAEILKSTR